MIGRRSGFQDDGALLGIRTDVAGKGKEKEMASEQGGGSMGGRGGGGGAARAQRHDAFQTRAASLDSISSTDDAHNTHLSASSAGNDTLSSSILSAGSTTLTSTMGESTLPAVPPLAHPTVTVLELVSNTASSSALPDSFGFNMSRRGCFVAVYTASNVWLIKTSQLPRLWARTLQVKRKPVAIDITENGFLLAVLSRPSQVDLYEIHGEQDKQIRKRKTVMLVHEASTIALSPDGLILITLSKFGIEVIAIGPDAPESSRRNLSGPVGDTLEFSDDGRTLLITGYARKNGTSSMFVLPGLYDGPLNEEGEPVPASPEAQWTGLVLFPETAKIARQATLLPDGDTGQVNELFAFNADEDTWGVYDIAGQRFTQRKMFLPDQQRWTRSEFLDDAMPSVSPDANLAAVALRMRGTTSLWIYQVPEWDFKPQPTDADQHTPIQPCFCIPILPGNIDSHQELHALRWVKIDDNVQRLIAVGNLSAAPAECESEGPVIPQGSKGVLIVLDFDRRQQPGGPAPVPKKLEYDLDPLLPGEKLPEGAIDFEQEVELVRTRTMAQRRAQDRVSGGSRRNSRQGPPGRSQTTAARERPTSIRPAVPPLPTITRNESEEEGLTVEEVQAAFEAPYDNTQPRSQSSLARAATVAALSPANRRHLRALPFRPLEVRRADGMREFPHESDADNWVPPPPAYTATAEAAHSVSLSHPGAPPAEARMPLPATGVPAVPPLPANARRPSLLSNRFSGRGSMSHSSTDLPLAAPQPRPALLHPSTYPSPQSPVPGRRGSQSAQPMPMQPDANLSAYQSTSNRHSRRPSLRNRRAVESSVELRPPPVIDPSMMRRGSAPDSNAGIMQRLPVPGTGVGNRASMPMSNHQTQSTNMNVQARSNRRMLLPRLSTSDEARANAQQNVYPVSAPVRGYEGQMMGMAPQQGQGQLSGYQQMMMGQVQGRQPASAGVVGRQYGGFQERPHTRPAMTGGRGKKEKKEKRERDGGRKCVVM